MIRKLIFSYFCSCNIFRWTILLWKKTLDPRAILKNASPYNLWSSKSERSINKFFVSSVFLGKLLLFFLLHQLFLLFFHQLLLFSLESFLLVDSVKFPQILLSSATNLSNNNERPIVWDCYVMRGYEVLNIKT